jgi:hypothetical protein
VIAAMPRIKTNEKQIGRQVSAKPNIFLSLDGLLSDDVPRNKPVGDVRPGAAAFTQRLSKYYNIYIYTSRTYDEFNVDRREKSKEELAAPVAQWCDANGIWYDGVWVGRGKPPAAYLFVGPRELTSPLNPTPDDFVELETLINARCTKTV